MSFTQPDPRLQAAFKSLRYLCSRNRIVTSNRPLFEPLRLAKAWSKRLYLSPAPRPADSISRANRIPLRCYSSCDWTECYSQSNGRIHPAERRTRTVSSRWEKAYSGTIHGRRAKGAQGRWATYSPGTVPESVGNG